MKKPLIIILALLCSLCPVFAQEDTLSQYVDSANVDASCKFSTKQLIAPALLIGFGTWGLAAESPIDRLEDKAKDDLNPHGHKCKADEYIQYVPTAAHLFLGFGVKSKHNFRDRLIASATANLMMGTVVNIVKYTVKETRPDSSKRNSFFSGHTATAFTGAELMRIEYGWGYGSAAYAVAASVGFLRVYNKRHWVGDVLAGAGVGILCADVGYWMLPVWKRLFRIDKKKESKRTIVAAPFYQQDNKAAGLSCSILLQ